MRYRLPFILFAFAFFSCKDNITDKSKRNENWVWWVDAKTGKGGWISSKGGEKQVKNGTYTYFYFNGNKFSTGKLVDGMDADTIFYYDINGHLQGYKILKADSLEYFIHDGPIKIFDADGDIAATGIIKNHTYGDKWFSSYKNGYPRYVRDFKNDTGWATTYYSNGKAADSDFYEGKKSFNIKHWYESGHLERINEFKDGNLNGTRKEYYENGQLHKIGYYKNGQQFGMVKAYYEDGKIYAQGEEINGVLNGMQIIYYENGTIQVEGNAKDGKRDGEFKKYAENGQLVVDRIFKEGVLIEDKIRVPIIH
jgi:antitoxin component YwqK of YwqJK toxin-antitoxin module